MNRASTYFTVGVATVIGSLLTYIAYFDYKRRNDVEFRKKLKKDYKKVHRSVKAVEEREKAQRTEDLKVELEKIKAETVPALAEERERYFMEHVGVGEQLSVQGPAFHIPAALSFYRALKVYPSPVELIMIYQKTVPEPIFKIVMDLTSMDVSNPIAPDLGVDDDAPTTAAAASGRRSAASSRRGASGDERTGPPSEASSQEWETLTDPGSQGSSAYATPPRT